MRTPLEKKPFSPRDRWIIAKREGPATPVFDGKPEIAADL